MYYICILHGKRQDGVSYGKRQNAWIRCGVKKQNIQELHDRAGIVVFHTTGRKGVLDSGMRYRKQTVAMGLPSLSEYEIWQTDEDEFRACAEIVHSFAGAKT